MNVKSLLIRSMGIVCSVIAGSLHAAEEMDDFFDKSPLELAAIPVSVSIATGSPKSLAQSAGITSVITAEQIKSMGATELHEVLETVPGIHASVQSVTGDYHYTIRGIQNATNSELLILLNGTRITTPFRGTLMSGTELPVEAIQQVEVIRGPGSALYGADAFAGVVNIITKKAKDIDGANVGGRVGDHGTQSGWGQYGTQWAGWDIAASLQYQHTDGDNGRIIKADTQTIFDRIAGTHASHAPGSLDTRYETFNGHFNLQRKHWTLGFWALHEDTGTRAGLTGALDTKGSGHGAQYLADVRFSTEDWFENWEFMAHGSYLRADFESRAQAFPDNAKLPIGTDGNISISPTTKWVLFPEGYLENISTLEQIPAGELSALYKGLNGHLLRASVGFRREQLATTQYTNSVPDVIHGSQPVVDGQLQNITGTSASVLADTSRSIWSFALQDEWQITNSLQLTAGLRYDDYSDFGGTINPRAALVWTINDQMTSKWLYGRAFRAPNFSELGLRNNITLKGDEKLQPETIDTVEWAFDYHPTASIRTAVNLYYYDLKKHITLGTAKLENPEAAQTENSISAFQNFGHRDGYGTELEGSWQINEQWLLKGNYAWQHAIDQDFDTRVAGVPEHHVYAAAIWQFLPKWQLQSQLNWIGNRSNPIPYNGALKDYQTVDFTLRGKKIFEHLTVSASLRNAFDSTPYEPASSFIGENLPMPGRSFYLEAALHF
ncbi:MAG: TonB-dependent receptor [Methylococcales bacterium]